MIGHSFLHRLMPQSSREKLRELLEERYEILKAAVETEKERMRMGAMSPGGMTEATTAMLRAEADLCSTDSAQIKVHEKIVTILREQEDSVARSSIAGFSTPVDVSRARLARVEAQIELEKMKLAPKIQQRARP